MAASGKRVRSGGSSEGGPGGLKQKLTREQRRAAWWQNKQQQEQEEDNDNADDNQVARSSQGFLLGDTNKDVKVEDDPSTVQTKKKKRKHKEVIGEKTGSDNESVSQNKKSKTLQNPPTKQKDVPSGSDEKGKMSQKSKQKINQKKKKQYVLFLGNLHFSVTEEDVRKHFMRTGFVEAVRLLTDVKTKKPRGCGYIEFSDTQSHKRALQLHESMLKGRKINVEFTSAGRKTDRRMEHLKEKNRALAKFKIPFEDKIPKGNMALT